MFILSPGADPQSDIQKFSDEMNMNSKFKFVALGKQKDSFRFVLFYLVSIFLVILFFIVLMLLSPAHILFPPFSIFLGQGQGPFAEQLLEAGE